MSAPKPVVTKGRVLVASTNHGKLAEISSALSFEGWEFVTVDELGAVPLEVEETGDTFLANARLKAHAYAEAFGMAALADDSGLEVDFLGGAPGVRSARYAVGECDMPRHDVDDANNARLLAELEEVPVGQRTARFRSVIVLVDENGAETVADGACEGTIGLAPRGTGGFGYDPLFQPDAAPGHTMAELSLAEKNAISHRGDALRNLKAILGG